MVTFLNWYIKEPEVKSILDNLKDYEVCKHTFWVAHYWVDDDGIAHSLEPTLCTFYTNTSQELHAYNRIYSVIACNDVNQFQRELHYIRGTISGTYECNSNGIISDSEDEIIDAYNKRVLEYYNELKNKQKRIEKRIEQVSHHFYKSDLTMELLNNQ